MKKLMILGAAALLGVASGAKGVQVFTPPATGEGAIAEAGLTGATVASWSANTLYVRDGTGRNRVALRAEKDVSQLAIGDISGKQAEFATVAVVRLDSLGDPLIGESLGKMAFSAPPNAGPRKQLLAVAWLFAIGLIGMATVGRRKKL